MIGKDIKTKWRKYVVTKNVRTRIQNIVIHLFYFEKYYYLFYFVIKKIIILLFNLKQL